MLLKSLFFKAVWAIPIVTSLIVANVVQADLLPDEPDYELKQLGKYVFFDKISEPGRMSCATCHDPTTGGTNGKAGTNIHQVAVTGADPHTVGSLKPPTNIYASKIAPFHECGIGGVRPFGAGSQQYCGGNFWDGRAEGSDSGPVLPGATKHIGEEVFQGASASDPIHAYAAYFGPTTDQALNPMPNLVEQNIQRQDVCTHVADASYAALYEAAWGQPINCSSDLVVVVGSDVASETEFDISFKRLMLAVGAWQASLEMNSFSSKRDFALRQELACDDPDSLYTSYFDQAVCDDEDYVNSPGSFPLVGLSAQENLGHDLFYNTAFPFGSPPRSDLPVVNCSFCHRSEDAPSDGTHPFERYTDDAYHNIGVPLNPELPASPTRGIAAHADAEQAIFGTGGGFKTPTLRNVDQRKGKGFTKAYTHNGWFKSLESLVHFYNTSKVKPRCEGAVTEKVALKKDCWPEPEWPATTTGAARLVGDLGMNAEQEAAVVAYLKTLSDLEIVKAPKPYKKGK